MGVAVASQTAFAAEATAVAVSPAGNEVLVGGRNNIIQRYTLSGGKLTAKDQLTKHRGAITRIAYSQDGKMFASADTNRDVIVWDAASGQPKVSDWCYHTSTVKDIAWSPDSVSLDQQIIVWNVNEQNKRIVQKLAHQGGVNCVRFLDANTLVTGGQDCAVRSWTISY